MSETLLGDWLSTTQAARILGLSSERVRQLMVSGKLKHQRTPIGRLIDPRSIEELRRERAAGAAARAG